MNVVLQIRADVINAMTLHLEGTESLAEVIEDVAYWESSARKRYMGRKEVHADPIECAVRGPLKKFTVDLSKDAVRMLRDSLRPGETLDSLVTALLITEVRYMRTGLHWPILCADEPVMNLEGAILAFLIRHPETTVTTLPGEHIMYSITIAVRTDVLTEFDSTLEAWEDRSEELLALVHLEDEARDEGTAMVSAHAVSHCAQTTAIDVQIDAHDLAALYRVLGPDGNDDALFTALMLGALNGYSRGQIRADDPLRMPA